LERENGFKDGEATEKIVGRVLVSLRKGNRKEKKKGIQKWKIRILRKHA